MIANINTIAFQGVNTVNVDVQVHVANGVPAFNIVGLPDKAIAESKERIRAALTSINIPLPPKRITVNLSPADLFKEGSHYDLPIALGLLVIIGAIPSGNILDSYFVTGELSLSGSAVSVPGVLPTAISALQQKKGLICPYSNFSEASLINDISIIPVKDLTSLIQYFNGRGDIVFPERCTEVMNQEILDMKDVKGQFVARRAVEIAAAGGHNLLMVGPPGTGKSMLAKRLLWLLPNLNNEEVMEVNVISSVTKRFDGSNYISHSRPFREPHSSCSVAAMVGGGKNAKPGEITLAHKGILFLDELPEFSRCVLESLRQPLEDKKVTISRANAHITYPADFQLVAAMNPCRCGYLGDSLRSCSKAPKCGADYQNKISGPLLDRMDMHVEVSNVNILSSECSVEPEDTKTIKARVIAARKKQESRYQGLSFNCNALVRGEFLNKFLRPNEEGMLLLEEVLKKNYLSTRGYTRILKVARTIADLDGSNQIKRIHVAEALSYRMR